MKPSQWPRLLRWCGPAPLGEARASRTTLTDLSAFLSVKIVWENSTRVVGPESCNLSRSSRYPTQGPQSLPPPPGVSTSTSQERGWSSEDISTQACPDGTGTRPEDRDSLLSHKESRCQGLYGCRWIHKPKPSYHRGRGIASPSI